MEFGDWSAPLRILRALCASKTNTRHTRVRCTRRNGSLLERATNGQTCLRGREETRRVWVPTGRFLIAVKRPITVDVNERTQNRRRLRKGRSRDRSPAAMLRRTLVIIINKNNRNGSPRRYGASVDASLHVVFPENYQ